MNDSEQHSRKNRQWSSALVEPFKQIKIGFYVLAISIGFVFACAGMIITAFRDQYIHIMTLFNVAEDMQYELMTNDIFWSNARSLVFLFVGFITVMMIVVFKMTHKYYGPLVSVERFVEDVSSGNYSTRVSIRGGDELQRLVGKLNSMADQLEKKHGRNVDQNGKAIDRRDTKREEQTTT